MTYFISRIIFKVLLKILLKFEVIGRENIPQKGPFIIASNHVSLIDPAVVGVACNTSPLVFMAKQELFNLPILGRWFRAVGCIPTYRHSRGFRPLKEAVQKLKQGRPIAIFPEGTRSTDGQLQKPELGIGLIALKSGAPIVPVYISGTAKVLPRGRRSIRLCKIRAKIGSVVDIAESSRFSERRKVYEFIGKRVMNAISRLRYE